MCEDLSLEEAKNLSVDEIEIDWDNYCYNPENNRCDGSCQGASSCPRARYLWSLEFKEEDDKLIPYETENSFNKPTVDEMKRHFKEMKHASIIFDTFIETEEGKEFIESLKSSFNKEN